MHDVFIAEHHPGPDRPQRHAKGVASERNGERLASRISPGQNL
jgi:hypothetical protein